MSSNRPDDPGSPSDRFLPYRGAANKTSHAAPPLNKFLPGPTSDLSQAIGNLQNPTQDQHQPPSYQPQDYQFPYPSQNYQGQISQPQRPSPNHPMDKTTPGAKWTPEADALLIELRGKGLKWDAVAKKFPGRSAMACRLHYQNYLEKDDKWSEERKDQLARAYEKNKEDMWAIIAQEMGCSVEEAEAVHWELGEADLASRAGTQPFSRMLRPSDRI